MSGQNRVTDLVETASVTLNIPWEPLEFAQQVTGLGHPRSLVKGLACELVEAIRQCAREPPSTVGQFRTATMRQWMLEAQALRDADRECLAGLPEHLRKVLKGKRLCTWKRLLELTGYCDAGVVDEVAKGFELMGPLPPASGAFVPRHTHATLMPEQVRETARAAQRAVWNSTRATKADPVADEVYRCTVDELQLGWLEGPFSLEQLPSRAILTRRLGVEQRGVDDLGNVKMKVRPIDDFSESLVNFTNSSSDSIVTHGVDTIAGGILLRLELAASRGQNLQLVMRTTDLRKAYKQLGLASSALNDAYLCVFNPKTKSPEAYKCRVLPFGARAAVHGFCRSAYSLWFLGTVGLKLHWTDYFDDYVTVATAEEAKHVGLITDALFSLVGWATSEEKDQGFQAHAKELGVLIDLSSAGLGTFAVGNTDSRKSELSASISALLSKGSYGKGELAPLRGRLQFAESQVFGRASCAAVGRLSKRAALVRGGAIDHSLKLALTHLRDRVVNGERRRLEARPRSVWHLFTDACFEPERKAGLGFVCFNSLGEIFRYGGMWLAPKHVDLINSDLALTIIFELEFLAALCGLWCCRDVLTRSELLSFIDNQAVLGCLVSCRADKSFAQKVLDKVVSLESDLDIAVWYDRVPSHSNISDKPSRTDFSDLPEWAKVDIPFDAILGQLGVT